MDIFQSVLAARLILILGIINLASISLIFLSCRCIPGWKLTRRLTKYRAYKRFFQYHCYIWWVFWPSVIVHAVFAVGVAGIPF